MSLFHKILDLFLFVKKKQKDRLNNQEDIYKLLLWGNFHEVIDRYKK